MLSPTWNANPEGEWRSFDRFREKSTLQSGANPEGDTFERVCFSPEGDLVGGLVVTAIGIDAYRHLRGQDNHLLFATVAARTRSSSAR